MATRSAALPIPIPRTKDELLLPAFTLWLREVVRFYRQRARVVGVIASPILFWVAIGSGFGTSFRSGANGNQNYLEYFYPGALIMIVLFTSIFTMMSVIEDRKEGFLLSVLVAPVSRSAIVLGKVLGGTTLATIQGLIFLVFAPLVGVHIGLGSFALISSYSFPGLFRANRARVCHCLAHGFDPSLSRNYQFISHSALAALRRAVPSFWRIRMAAGSDAN